MREETSGSSNCLRFWWIVGSEVLGDVCESHTRDVCAEDDRNV